MKNFFLFVVRASRPARYPLFARLNLLTSGNTYRKREYISQAGIHIASGNTYRKREYISQAGIHIASGNTYREREYISRAGIHIASETLALQYIRISINLHYPLPTPHSPLSTPHSPLPIPNSPLPTPPLF
ncbi:MAG: hypothetical protein KME64_04955 [Scytonematopsis contorta HA4267-MV1]|nr:hypothetical protein [Scytonematopsis contorta HA4267-MV1]